MAQAGAGAAFAEESIARTRPAVLAADDLDRDFVAEQRPPRPIDRAHPPLGQQRQDLVAIVEDLAGGEHGSIRPYGSGFGRRSMARQAAGSSRGGSAARRRALWLDCAAGDCVAYRPARLLVALVAPLPRRDARPARPSSAPTSGSSRAAEFEEYLRTAKVEKITDIPIGVTRPQRASLAPGGLVGSFAWKPLRPGLPERLLRELQVGNRRLRARQAPRPEHGPGRRRTARRTTTLARR